MRFVKGRINDGVLTDTLDNMKPYHYHILKIHGRSFAIMHLECFKELI